MNEWIIGQGAGSLLMREGGARNYRIRNCGGGDEHGTGVHGGKNTRDQNRSPTQDFFFFKKNLLFF